MMTSPLEFKPISRWPMKKESCHGSLRHLRRGFVTCDAKLTLNGPLALFDPLLGLAFRTIGDRAAVGLRRVFSGQAVDR